MAIELDPMKVVYRRRPTNQIDTVPIVDGQLIYDIETGATYQDVGDVRMPTGGSRDAVLYTPQDLAPEQKEQARNNINAATIDDSTILKETTFSSDKINRDYANTFVGKKNGKRLVLNDSRESPLHNLIVHGRVTQEGEPSPTKVASLVIPGASGQTDYKILGKNLYLLSDDPTYIKDGVTFEQTKDGIHVYGTATSDYADYYSANMFFPEDTYTFGKIVSNNQDANVYMWGKYRDEKGTLQFFGGNDASYVVKKPIEAFFIRAQKGVQIDCIVKPYCYIGKEISLNEYSPPTEPQVLSLFTPNGLPGLPVANGGNYIDSEGQQWICDEIDLGRGVYVQRVKYEPLDASFIVGTGFIGSGYRVSYNKKVPRNSFVMSDRLKLNNVLSQYSTVGDYMVTNESDKIQIRVTKEGITSVSQMRDYLKGLDMHLLYPLFDPVETPLPKTTINTYKKLHTNYPGTTILLSENTEQTIVYSRDSNKVIPRDVVRYTKQYLTSEQQQQARENIGSIDINDNAITSKQVWSSRKIYNNIGEVKTENRFVKYTVDPGYLGGFVGELPETGTQDWWRHAIIPVKPGDYYHVSGLTGNGGFDKGNHSLISLFDADGIIRYVFVPPTDNSQPYNAKITIPNNVVSMGVCSYSNNPELIVIEQLLEINLQDQINSLVETIEFAQFTPGANRLNKDTVIPGKYWETDGRLEDDADWFASDYCLAEPNTEYGFYSFDESRWEQQIYYNLFDANKVFLKGGTTYPTGKFTTTSETKYIRFSQTLHNLNKRHGALISTSDQAQITGYPSYYFDVRYPKPQSTMLGKQEGLPDYYPPEWMSSRIAKVRNNNGYLRGVSFAFLTDVHFRDNSKNSKYMLQAIMNSTSVSMTLFGGDVPVAFGQADQMKADGDELVEYQNMIGKDRFFTVRGNHDFTTKYGADAPEGATLMLGETYNYLNRNAERYVSNMDAEHLCYCIDNDAQKCRIIMLNSCDAQGEGAWAVYYRVSTEQIVWMVKRITEKTGWHFIVVSHIPADPFVPGYDASQDEVHKILVALKNKGTYNGTSFADTTNDLVFHLCGHNHTDESHVNQGVLSVATTCDAYYKDDGLGAKPGTITEQAFDVFSIDFDTRKIHATRFGRGSDREWNY